MNAIVDSILAQQRETGAWELSADTVRELLGIDHADFYRRIYEEAMRGNRMVDLSMTTARFRQENAGELVTLLELFEGTTAEQELEHAGIFFSHETRFEITSRLLRRAGEAASAHTVDRSAFEAMLDRLGSYRRARGRYLDEYFSLAALIADTAREYVELAGYPEPDLAAANVRALLEHYFSRHVLERETVLAAVCIELFEIAVEVGAVRRPEEEWAEEERERRAREVMELESHDNPLTTSRLKAQYKALMKRYHPDVNPRGLRTCQRINEAYSLLLASAADSP